MKYSREELEARLSAYLDNELSGTERAEVEAYLRKDAAARSLLADLQSMRTAMQALPRARASADMMESIRARMERQALLGDTTPSTGEARRSLSTAGRWAAAAVIVLMTSVGGYVIWNLNAPQRATTANQPLASLDKKADDLRLSDRDSDFAANGSPAAPGELSGGAAGTPLTVANEARPESLEKKSAFARDSVPVAAPAAASPAPARERAPVGTELAQAPRAVNEQPARPQRAEPNITLVRPASPAFAMRRMRPGSAGAGGDAEGRTRGRPENAYRIVTLNCESIESKRKLIGELSARAVSVSSLSNDAQSRAYFTTLPAKSRSAGYGVQTSPAGEAPHTDALTPAPEQEHLAATSVERKTEYYADSRPYLLSQQTAAQDQVTDLLVVVADDKAREEVLRKLGRLSEAADSGASEQPASDGLNNDETPLPPAQPAELPADSIVHTGRGVEKSKDAAGTISLGDQPVTSYGHAAVEDAAKPLSTQSNADNRLIANMPAEPAVTATQTANAGITHMYDTPPEAPYVLRLHIKVQEPASRPAWQSGEDLATTPASTPAEAIPFNPSVLDLGKRPKSGVPATRPSASQP